MWLNGKRVDNGGSGVEDEPLDDFEESQEMCNIYSDRWEGSSEGLQLNWLEYRTVDPVVAGSNPVGLAEKMR